MRMYAWANYNPVSAVMRHCLCKSVVLVNDYVIVARSTSTRLGWAGWLVGWKEGRKEAQTHAEGEFGNNGSCLSSRLLALLPGVV